MRRRTLLRGLATGAALALVNSGATRSRALRQDAGTVPAYVLTDLGGFPGISGASEALSINDSGEVTGFAIVSDRPLKRHAVVWKAEGMTDLGPSGADYTVGTAINATGMVAGEYRGVDGMLHAGFWNGGELQGLNSLYTGETRTTGINDPGQVVGYTEIEDGTSRGLIWSGSDITDLGSLGGVGAAAAAINASGQVVGFATLEGGFGGYHAFLWSGGLMSDLGSLPGGGLSVARAINEGGDVAGYSTRKEGGYRATLFADGKVIDLGTLGGANSDAYGINDAGDVVGEADYAEFGYFSAALFKDGQVVNLTEASTLPEGWRLIRAYDINGSGQICGVAAQANSSVSRAFLLTPISGATPMAIASRLTPRT